MLWLDERALRTGIGPFGGVFTTGPLPNARATPIATFLEILRMLKGSARGWIGLGLAAAMLFVALGWHFRPVPDPDVAGRRASAWVADLLSPEYPTRVQAQTTLELLGAPGVPQLCRLLRRQNPAWQPLLARLARHFRGFDFRPADTATGRLRAVQALAGLGPHAAAAVPDLIDALADEGLASDVERTLSRIGEAAHPALCCAVRTHSNPGVRTRAARKLREIPGPSAASVAALSVAAADARPEVRAEAAKSLGSFRWDHRKAESTLRGLLADAEPTVRAAAVRALAPWRPSGLETRVSLVPQLDDPAPVVRLEAARACWSFSKDPSQVLPVLGALLETDHGWEAAYVLGEMRAAAAPAIPALVRALRRERVPRPFRTPPSSVFALGQIGVSAVPALQPVLEDPDPANRVGAVMAFGFMAAEAKPFVPALLPLLNDSNPEVRHTTALTLGMIGANTPEVIASLDRCLAAEDIYMRSTAARLLQTFAPEGTWVVQPE